jgi:flagellar biosynthetic protein FliQ
MTEAVALGIARDAIWTALRVAAPVLGVSLVVGLLVGVLQAVTQINEATLAFIPKALAVVLVIMLFGPWMLNTLVSYAAAIFANLPAVVS